MKWKKMRRLLALFLAVMLTFSSVTTTYAEEISQEITAGDSEESESGDAGNGESGSGDTESGATGEGEANDSGTEEGDGTQKPETGDAENDGDAEGEGEDASEADSDSDGEGDGSEAADSDNDEAESEDADSENAAEDEENSEDEEDVEDETDEKGQDDAVYNEISLLNFGGGIAAVSEPEETQTSVEVNLKLGTDNTATYTVTGNHASQAKNAVDTFNSEGRATVAVTGNDCEKTYAQAAISSNGNFEGGLFDLSRCLYTFNNTGAANTYKISAVSLNNGTVYVKFTNKHPNSSANDAANVQITMTEDGYFHLTNGSGTQLCYDSTNHYFSTSSGVADFELYALATGDGAKDSPITGYQKVTQLSEITSGKKYLIVTREIDGERYVLVPANEDTREREHTAKLVQKKTSETDVEVTVGTSVEDNQNSKRIQFDGSVKRALHDCLYTFNQDNGGASSGRFTGKDASGAIYYINFTNVNSDKIVNRTNSCGITVEKAETDLFRLRFATGNYSYAGFGSTGEFWSANNCNDAKIMIYEPAHGEGSGELPGYKKITALSELKHNGSYLFIATRTDQDTTKSYVLNPDSSAVCTQLALLTDGTTARDDVRPAGTTVTFTAKKAGTSTITIGSTTFNVNVAPAAPTGLTVSGVTARSAKLSWTGSAGATSYKVYNGETCVATVENASCTLENLTPETTYDNITVTAVASALESDHSEVADSFTTLKEQFTVSVKVATESVEFGTVSIQGVDGTSETVDSGKEVTVIATATDQAYRFKEWQDAEKKPISASAEYTFSVTANTMLIAVFEPIPTYTVSLSLTSTAVGEVSVDDVEQEFDESSGEALTPLSYQVGKPITLKAEARTGYNFVGWVKLTDGGQSTLSSNAMYEYTMNDEDGNVKIKAVFARKSYTITVTYDSNKGSVSDNNSGNTSYKGDTTATFVATPKHGFQFDGWFEGEERQSTDRTYEFTVEKDRNLTASFSEKWCTVSAAANEEDWGTVAITTSSANPNESGQYQEGTTITVTATARTGYEFVKWTLNGKDVENGTAVGQTFTVEDATKIVAVFQMKTFAVTAESNHNDWGSVTVSGGTTDQAGHYQEGSVLTVTATTKDPNRYDFAFWQNENGGTIAEASYSFTVTEDVKLTAVFLERTYQVTVELEGAKSTDVSVTLSPDNQEHAYTYETSVTATASVGTDCEFVGWKVGGLTVSNDITYTFDVTSNMTLTAVFKTKAFAVTASVDESCADMGSAKVVTEPNDGTSYTKNTVVTVKAEAQYGYEFVKWLLNGTEVQNSSAEQTFTITEATELKAVFQKKMFAVSVTSANASQGTAQIVTTDDAGKFQEGSRVTVKAEAAYGYHFAGWRVSGSSDYLSTDAEYTFTVEKALTLEAVFETTMYTVSVSTLAGGSVEITSPDNSGSYQEGTDVTVKATAAADYRFLKWTENGKEVSTDESYTFKVQGATSLVAVFERIYTITVVVDSQCTDMGAVDIDGYSSSNGYAAGEQVTVTATAKPGYRFVEWKNGTLHISKAESHSFAAADALTLTAYFEKIEQAVVAEVTTDQVKVEWPAYEPKGADAGKTVKGYYVYLNGVRQKAPKGKSLVRMLARGGSASLDNDYLITDTRYVFEGLQPGTQYRVTIDTLLENNSGDYEFVSEKLTLAATTTAIPTIPSTGNGGSGSGSGSSGSGSAAKLTEVVNVSQVQETQVTLVGGMVPTGDSVWALEWIALTTLCGAAYVLLEAKKKEAH